MTVASLRNVSLSQAGQRMKQIISLNYAGTAYLPSYDTILRVIINQLCFTFRMFDLRFIIIQDRYDKAKYQV